MTDYKELVKALRWCVGKNDCDECKYQYEGLTGTDECKLDMLSDAAVAIEGLQAEMKQAAKHNAELHAEFERLVSAAEGLQAVIGQIRWERDLAMEQLEENGIAFGANPKRGEWKRVEDGESYHYECTQCGERPLYTVYGHIALSETCPNCGARMEGAQHEGL